MLKGSPRRQSPDPWGCGSQSDIAPGFREQQETQEVHREVGAAWCMICRRARAFRKRRSNYFEEALGEGGVCPPTQLWEVRDTCQPSILATSDFLL